MNLLFIADPLASFKAYKDSTFAMMRAAQARGHRVHACEMDSVHWVRGGKVCATAKALELTPDGTHWYKELPEGEAGPAVRPLHSFDAVLMRKDPPFDSEYFYATHLLSQAEREGARVFNRAESLRNHPEKLSILEFPELIGPTLVTRNADDIRAFHAQYKDIILKPLDGMGGAGIFQQFLPKIAEGDKRVLLIAGKPVPYCLARIPQGGEVRGNLAAGGKGVAQPLSPRDREIAETLGPVLFARGLLLVGLDVIGDCVTEINVTSPTGFQEIAQQTGFDVATTYIEAIEQALVQA
jgi:glutathione synthase